MDSSKLGKVVESLGRFYVGSPMLLRKVLAGALADGHILFEDYPGLGKTLLVKILARTLGCRFTRIQFTPDLLPSDIVGGRTWDPRTGEFRLHRGPIFTHVLLADEINRAPPKTQAALLEAMEERQVTIEGETHPIEPPFFVLATQNPLEQEGTYPLPEAEMDRFLMRLSLGYPPTPSDEVEVLKRRVAWRKNDPSHDVPALLSAESFLALQRGVEEIFVHESVLEYISRIVRSLRDHPKVEVGPSPRGGIALLRLSRAHAAIEGRDYVVPDDVRLFAVEALSHRTILEVEEVVEGTRPERVVQEVLAGIPPPAPSRVGG